MSELQIGKFKVQWLNGGDSQLDGGAMFGVVPKALWTRKYPCNEKNLIPMRNDPLLIQGEGKNFLIDSGMGINKMGEKQLRNFGVQEQAKLEESLNKIGLKKEDIHGVLMTHLHFDHASGLTTKEKDKFVSFFPHAIIYTSQIEWNEMISPNIRSKNTYVRENWEPIVSQIQTFQHELEVVPGLKMIHTGGHSEGHSIVKIESEGASLLHLGDLLPTHAHQNVLWVMAYDDYPMTSIFKKEEWIKNGIDNGSWFTFYHDAFYRAIKWNNKDEIIAKIQIGNLNE